MIRIGVIGWGHWGPNLTRNVAAAEGCRLSGVADLSTKRLAEAALVHPGVALTTKWDTLLADPRIDAIAVATPACTHFGMAMAALRAGKHVLLEKPIAQTSEQVLMLMEESARRGLVLMVDHTFIFSPAVRRIRELLTAGELGRLCYYDSARLNRGLVRDDVNVLWDVATHDLSLLDAFQPASPVALQATGWAPLPGERERLAYLTLSYPDGFVAHVHASWIAPVKTRRIVLGGTCRLLVYDDVAPVRPVTIYDAEIESSPHVAAAADHCGAGWSLEVDGPEPLRAVVDHFVACVVGGVKPLTDGPAGLRVVRQLEAADLSLAAGGRIIELDRERVAA